MKYSSKTKRACIYYYMQVFKFIILMLILISSSLIGILIAKKYVNRVNELKQIKSALNILETKIKFTYQPLKDIFTQISKTEQGNTKEIFSNAAINMENMNVKDAWKKSIDSSSLSLNNEDKNVLKELGGILRKNRCKWTSKSNRSNKFIYRYANRKSRSR